MILKLLLGLTILWPVLPLLWCTFGKRRGAVQ